MRALYRSLKISQLTLTSIFLLILCSELVAISTASEQVERLAQVTPSVLLSQSNFKSEIEESHAPKADIEREEIFDSNSRQAHSRKKRLVWITDDGRLALPPGTALTVTPTISMPLVRHPPEGFFSNVSISFPLTIDFDKLGLTDESNPLGDLPPIFTREFGRSTGHVLGDYVARYIHYKSKRDLYSQRKPLEKDSGFYQIREEYQNADNLELPRLPENLKHAFHGGERVLLYGMLEDLLGTFGVNGKACLLRTICEVHSRSIYNFGVFGEISKLFLTATSSPFADLIPEHVRAQQIGEGRVAPGECFPYYKDCPKSIFRSTQKDKYGVSQQEGRRVLQENEVIQQKLPAQLQKISSEKSTNKPHKKKKIFSM